MKHCNRFLGEVKMFLSLERLPCVKHWSCPKAEKVVEHPPSGDAIDLLIPWITRRWPCNQGSTKKKKIKNSGLDLRCGRFLLWANPERQQCLRSHLSPAVCFQGGLFLYSRNSWIFREISVCCHCLRSPMRTHSQDIILDFMWNQIHNNKLCIDDNMWPDVCDVTFSV